MTRLGSCNSRSGFTVVEMLVVTGIITLLMSMALPAMAKIRAASQSLQCTANLRSIGQGMMVYAVENHGAILGSGHTTSRMLWTKSSAGIFATVPGYRLDGTIPANGPMEIFDWMGPMARVMEVQVPRTKNAKDLFNIYRTLPQFKCPATDGVVNTPYTPSQTTWIDSGPMLSYTTAAGFLVMGYGNTLNAALIQSNSYFEFPQGYTPRLALVGGASEKIFCADGAKYTNSYDGAIATVSDYGDSGDHLGTDVKIQYSSFTDYGAFFGNTKSYCRAKANGYVNAVRDGRIFAYRHGTTSQNSSAGSYRLNAVFFDGHVESMDDMTASNPKYWLPKGTVILKPAGNIPGTDPGRPMMWPDVRAKYGITASKYVVP